jgi:anti-anti-sigma factor
MLNIILEFRKGILFVRLNGTLSRETVIKYNNDVSCMIKESGIKNVLINLNELIYIDFKGISSLFYTYELVRENRGRMMICGINDNIKKHIFKSHLLNYAYEIDNELDCFYEIVT